ALADDLGQRLHRLLERRVEVIAVALVEVDVVGAQARERGVQLLEDLLAREAPVAVHLEEELGAEDVRLARAIREQPAEDRLGAAARVDVRRVDEVDPHLERLRDAGLGLLARDAAAVGQPRAEADLRDFEVAGAEAAVTHARSSTITGRAY